MMAGYNEVPKTYNDFLVLRNSVQNQLNTFDSLSPAAQLELINSFELTLNSNIFFVNEAISGQRVTNKKTKSNQLTNTASGKNLSAQHPLFKFADGSEIRVVTDSNGEFDLSAKGSKAEAFLTAFAAHKLKNALKNTPRPQGGVELEPRPDNSFHIRPSPF